MILGKKTYSVNYLSNIGKYCVLYFMACSSRTSYRVVWPYSPLPQLLSDTPPLPYPPNSIPSFFLITPIIFDFCCPYVLRWLLGLLMKSDARFPADFQWPVAFLTSCPPPLPMLEFLWLELAQVLLLWSQTLALHTYSCPVVSGRHCSLFSYVFGGEELNLVAWLWITLRWQQVFLLLLLYD